jgi:hypothetical protein
VPDVTAEHRANAPPNLRGTWSPQKIPLVTIDFTGQNRYDVIEITG